jgi:hypothetical protein
MMDNRNTAELNDRRHSCRNIQCCKEPYIPTSFMLWGYIKMLAEQTEDNFVLRRMELNIYGRVGLCSARFHLAFNLKLKRICCPVGVSGSVLPIPTAFEFALNDAAQIVP